MEYHLPVMLDECMDGLNIKPAGVYVDATFGGGGHSRELLKRLGETGRLIAFDQDADAVQNAMDDARLVMVHENFRYLKNFLRMHGVLSVDGIMADLGVSSHQLDEATRGFSTRFDGPLDLRMDRRQAMTAADIVNTLDEGDLRHLLSLYGELPNAGAMAHAICQARQAEAIRTTDALKQAVSKLLPRGRENKYMAMLFQALRIEVNGELDALKALLTQAVEVLKPGGRLVVLSYHSLEDRLVKNMIKAGNFEGVIEKDFYGKPIVPLKPVGRRPITASASELAQNSRARSAKLRVAERVDEE